MPFVFAENQLGITVLCKSNASEIRELRSLFRDFIMEFRSKIGVKFHSLLSDNSLEQRAILLQSFVQLKKIREHKR